MGVSTYIQYIKKSFLKFKSLLTGGNERSYVLKQTCRFETYKGSVGGEEDRESGGNINFCIHLILHATRECTHGNFNHNWHFNNL